MTFSLYRTKLIQVFIKSKFILDIMLKKFSEVFGFRGEKLFGICQAKSTRIPAGRIKNGNFEQKERSGNYPRP